MRNEPAFPLQDWDACIQAQRTHTGMTLRDYFAAKAMQALLNNVGWKIDQELFGEIASSAYQQADAMLKAMENK